MLELFDRDIELFCVVDVCFVEIVMLLLLFLVLVDNCKVLFWLLVIVDVFEDRIILFLFVVLFLLVVSLRLLDGFVDMLLE